jgi:hypothetical protein
MIARMNYRMGIRITLVMLAFGIAALSQNPADEEAATWKTSNRWNGRFWRGLAKEQKNMFLAGYIDALTLVSEQAPSGSVGRLTSAFYWPITLTVDEVRTAVDRIYDAPENRPIPIGDIVSFPISMRVAGTEEQLVQKKIYELRAKTLFR